MFNPTTPYPASGVLGWPRRVESWLDDRGRPAWIVAMVLGFIAFWPVGLAILAYMIWSKRMFGRSSCTARRIGRPSRSWSRHGSGNSAFDAYRDETIRRLEDEREAFETFLKRLRDAKDKQEFDAFMDDRAKASGMNDKGPNAPGDVAA